MTAHTDRREEARERVLALLRSNDTGGYITPSRHQYIHQWLWDSCFHAIALARYDIAWARRELASVFDAQWDEGMLPHIRFKDGASHGYRPHADDWATGRPSSGITQPPLVAIAARVLHEASPDRAYLEDIIDPLLRYHAWLATTRDPEGTGLLVVVHPWESGTDNSPIYDAVRDRFLASGQGVEPPPRVDTLNVRAEERPRDDDYRQYWGLLRAFQGMGWSSRAMAERSGCRVHDLTFNSIWARANRDLAALLRELGREADAERAEARAEQTAAALREMCWSDEASFFFSYDAAEGALIPIRTVAGFLPLLAGAATGEMAAALVEALTDPRRFGGPHGVPSTAADERAYDPKNYWRGPIWLNMHYLIIDGLRRYGFHAEADELARKSLALVEASGYREYYDPRTGEGRGARDFCWSTLAHAGLP
jgi:glycogen debranching enzyme